MIDGNFEEIQKLIDSHEELQAAKLFKFELKKLIPDYELSQLMKNSAFKNIFLTFRQQKDPNVINVLSYNSQLITKEQKDILSRWLLKRSNNWDEIKDYNELLTKMYSHKTIKFIDEGGLKSAENAFNRVYKELIEEKSWIKAIDIIDKYNDFLLEIKSTRKIHDLNLYVNNRLIENTKLYKKIIKKVEFCLNKYESKIEIPDKILKN